MSETNNSSSTLFKPLKIGNTLLSHRIALAPLTRYRADDDHIHQSHATTYYAQRSSVPGTFLITEGNFISPRAAGYENAPGLWTSLQLEAWKKVTDAVHANGSYVYAQLWALGGAAKQSVLKDQFGYDVASSSSVPIADGDSTPRPLTEGEIWQLIEDYKMAARNAVDIAGFDGVEIHGGNGYLIDQFTQEVSNKREDKWGGSIENRARFAIEVTKAVIEAVGPDRTAIRLSPWSTYNSMGMDQPVPQFSFLIKQLSTLKLSYLHLVESRVSGNADTVSKPEKTLDFALEAWGKTSPILIAGGWTPQKAIEAADGIYKSRDVVFVFGRYFISNPDLPFRILNGIALASYDRSNFYVPKVSEGYIDYPFSQQFVQQMVATSMVDLASA